MNHSQYLLARLDAQCIHYGREDSFKLVPGRILADRVLIGVETARMAADALLALAVECGMSAAAAEVLYPRISTSNAVFFGFEELGASCVSKVYLEFWEDVKRQVQATGSRAPQLLHLGVKWDTARPERHEVARYDCHPMLNEHTILKRVGACHAGPEAAALCGITQDIIRQAGRHRPDASMLYLEVLEQGNARSSYDINLYKNELAVNDCAQALHSAGHFFGISAAQIDVQLERLGARPFGHLSSGQDRHGKPFLSVYAETAAL